VTGYRFATQLLALGMIAVGLMIFVVTISHGGGIVSVGVVLGALFVAAGAGRLYLLKRRQR
jgi:hypothetical protein